jgi:ATP-dependent RNA helicase DeaD
MSIPIEYLPICVIMRWTELIQNFTMPMPNERKPNEHNKREGKQTGRRFPKRRESYVDSFRWGFVAGSENDDFEPDSDSYLDELDKPEETAEIADDQPQKKRSRRRPNKKTVNAVNNADRDVPDQKEPAEAKREPRRSEPRSRSQSRNSQKSGQKQTPKPTTVRIPLPFSLVDDDDDNDLNLPSYGRTPIPTDDELPQPLSKNDRQREPKQRQTSSLRPDRQREQQSERKAEPSLASKPKTAPRRPKKEQMVWDPDGREYVPLIVTEFPKPRSVPPAKLSSAPRAAVPPRHDNAPAPKPRSAAPRSVPRVAAPPRSSRRDSVDSVVASVPETPPRQHRPKPPRGDVRPPMETSRQPNPADIESEVNGFAELGVSKTMLEALNMVRYLEPTPIQAGVFEKVRAGLDVMGQAQTGTGKTAAFSIPIIEGIETCPPGNDPVALILVPTRELAVQVRDEAGRLAYGRDVRMTACYGGKPLAKQIARLREGIDVIVGTPGRILDLVNRRALSLDAVRWLILDEADRMLDIGFRPDIEKILKRTPADRQTLLFSATLPAAVVRLAERYMKTPEILDFSSKGVAVDTIDQYYVTVDPERKFDALVHLLKEQQPQQAIIFTRTKRGADRLAKLLSRQLESLAVMHGDIAQNERDRVMGLVRAGKLRYLVATDVVGRGIDVSGISHIINYDIPAFCDDYVHRVGRTGRMGREGVAFTFVTVQEGSELTRIEMRIDKLLKRAELKGFESFTKPSDPNAMLEDDDERYAETKPVYGKRVRKVRRAL